MLYVAIFVPLIVLLMLVVMGVPFLYYRKRDQEYTKIKDLPEENKLQIWYGL